MGGTGNDLTYDVIVVGAGPAGENVADRAVQGGLSVAVVEDELVGGECSYWACIPTKALLRSTAALHAARQLPGARQAITSPLDVDAVLRRRDGFVSGWKDDGQVSWLQSVGIDLVRGRGRLDGPRTVEVTSVRGKATRLTARHAVVIATGSSALVPPVPGLADVPVWTNREAAAVKTVPGRLAIVGGGVVAAEMATAFARLGSTVTVLARDGVLPANEPFAGELVAQALKDMGVTVDFGTGLTAARLGENGSTVLSLTNGTELETDQLFLAVGRGPNTKDLGLSRVGLTPGEWLAVNDTMQVLDGSGNPLGGGWLYAVGDVNHRALLTHQGKYQARAAGDAIVARAAGQAADEDPWSWHTATADARTVPQVIFTDPEVAAVGLTAAQAERGGYRTRVVDYDLGSVSGAALHADGYAGRARMVVDEDRQVILGMTFVGPDVAELLHAATIAIAGEVPLKRLWHAVPAFPTISEVWLRLLEGYGRPSS
ncbi:MAG TPA: NAD(P)/FAD-dependent oxidoreductase [Trebonia sp.]|nr:NAD(P)/FAD-dependent oxidoreductase [Trebonia sp.]